MQPSLFPKALPLLLTTPLGTQARKQMVRPQSMSNASLACHNGAEAIFQRVACFCYRCWDWYTTGLRWGSRFIPFYVTEEDVFQILTVAFPVILNFFAVVVGLLGMLLPSASKLRVLVLSLGFGNVGMVCVG
jgi:hypothetical protein